KVRQAARRLVIEAALSGAAHGFENFKCVVRRRGYAQQALATARSLVKLFELIHSDHQKLRRVPVRVEPLQSIACLLHIHRAECDFKIERTADLAGGTSLADELVDL